MGIYCNAVSAPFPVESCCGHTSRMNPSASWPKCNNCGEVPTIKDPPQLAESLCMLKVGHRGRHSWAR